MNSHSPEHGTAIEIYQGQPLARIDATALVLSSFEQLRGERIYLAGDPIVGQYGVLGFLFVDNKPEDRYMNYTDGNYSGITYQPQRGFFLPRNIPEDDPARLSHFIGTHKGFKMIRHFLLPPEVKAFFKQDKFLGDPMIDKCCRAETLPEDFDEELSSLNAAYTLDSYDVYSAYINSVFNRALQIINSVNPDSVGQTTPRHEFGENVYVSFHPWPFYTDVIAQGEQSLLRAINNFDQLLSRFDVEESLSKRNLQIGQGNLPTLPNT